MNRTFLLVVLTALISSSATYIALNSQKSQQPEPTLITQSLPTPPPAGESQPSSVLAAQTISSAQKFTYVLPTGWKTIQDQTASFEVGYNPAEASASAGNKTVEFAYTTHPGSFRVSIQSYNDGSRHGFIYSQLGITNPTADQLQDYREKEYTYNGMSCLVLYGLAYSASGTTWGMCAINSLQAFFIAGPGNEEETEQLIQTILLK